MAKINKARRNELAKLKQKKRKEVLGIEDDGHHYLKSTGKPCSCMSCQPQGKYRDNGRSKNKQEFQKERG